VDEDATVMVQLSLLVVASEEHENIPECDKSCSPVCHSPPNVFGVTVAGVVELKTSALIRAFSSL